MNHIEVIGINYKTTPVAMRSKVAIGSRQLEEALDSLHRFADGGIIVGTCNRLEIYTLAPVEDASDKIIRFLVSRSGMDEIKLRTHVYIQQDIEAVRHLFKVAAGLDSMIIGEYEILGQVKRALDAVRRKHQAGLPLIELFSRAITCGRKVRSETMISRNALSVSSVSVDLAERAAGNIKDCQVLVVGAGEAGRQVAKTCRERGAVCITVISRSSHKGIPFAREIGGVWVPMDRLADELVNNDVVICCSGAPHTIIKFRAVQEAIELRCNKPQVIIDIGVPCNVDPAIKYIEQVSLYDIDEITAIARENYKERSLELEKAEEIVNSEADKYMAWWHEQKVKPLIIALVNRAENTRQAKLSKLFKNNPDFTDEQRVHIEALSKSMVQKILHEPIQCLKENCKNDEYLRIVKEMFNLDKTK